ncbi:MAG TPA: transglycosylase domain-containing protein [Parasegetibacter sp.]
MKKQSPSKQSKPRRAVRIFWRLFFGGMIAFVLIILAANFGLLGQMPSIEELENPSASLATEIYASDGTLMGKYYLQDRTSVKYKDISPHVINALIATEDERFYQHSGIDAKSLGRALFGVITFSSKGGASTITQQLALNLFDERAHNPVKRILQKIKEWIIAVKLERNFTKEEIITLYLNTVSFSDNVYGIRNASRTFFQKDPDRLTLDEAAVFVGMLKGPSLYNPRRNPKIALDRRNTVIDQMVRNNMLTAEEASTYKAKPIELNYRKLDENAGFAPYFRDVLREHMKNWCKTHKKENGENYNIYRDGLKVYTTINPRMQLAAEEAVAKHMASLQAILNNQSDIKSGKIWQTGNGKSVLEAAIKNSDRWRSQKAEGISEEEIRKSFEEKLPMRVFAWNSKRYVDTVMSPIDSIKYHKQMLQTGFMVMDPMSGEIKAWVGGIDFKTFKFDHVNINTKRQVGSTIKPLLYVQALKEAGFTPDTECENTPQCFPAYNNWCSKNSSGNSSPYTTMATGLAWSLNNVTAYIVQQVGIKRFAQFLRECKIESDIPEVPSLCLGVPDISLFEMMRAYTMFPNYGYNTEPIFISRIEDKNGHTLETFTTQRLQMITESEAYTMTNMMRGVVDRGTAQRLRTAYGITGEVAGKTGTTNDNTDGWFIGFTPQLLAGAWVGCDDPFIRISSNLYGQGSRMGMPIWAYFFNEIYKDKTLGIDKDAKFSVPESLRDEVIYDYMNLGKEVPPGAEGEDPAYDANDYMFMPPPGSEKIPAESELSEEEKKILEEARKNNKNDSNSSRNDKSQAIPSGNDREKKGLFQRIFKKKNSNELVSEN